MIARTSALGALLLAAGCARPTVEDSPSRFGTASDEVTRTCPDGADEVWEAAVKTLRENQFVIARRDHDKLGGDLVGERVGGRVFVRVKTIADERTSVSVRSEPPDRALSIRLQESFAHALGRGEARDGLFGGASASATTRLALDRALQVAADVFRALRIEEVGRKGTEGETDLKGRWIDSTPVRISIRHDGPGETRVTFIAGVSRNDAARALVRRMKQEFENRARLLAP